MDDYLSKPVQRMPLIQMAGNTHSRARSCNNELPHTVRTHTITYITRTHTRTHMHAQSHWWATYLCACRCSCCEHSHVS